MAMMNAQEMFQHEVGDIYDAENRFLKGQQEMLSKATDPKLQDLIQQHIEQTQQHIKNLDQVFGLLGQQPKGVTCDSAQGLVAEAQKAMQEAASDPIRDVLIDTAAAKVEHYEIASYRGLITDAELMGQPEIRNLLQQNLQQEEQAAQLLELRAPQLVRKALEAAGTTGITASGTAMGAAGATASAAATGTPSTERGMATGSSMAGQGMATQTPLAGTEPMATEPAGTETIVTEPSTVTGEGVTVGPQPVSAGQIRPGMAVIGSDAMHIGQVKEVRDSDFLVDRRGRRDVYVPFDAVQELAGDSIVLNLVADQVDDMNWQKPPLL